MTRGWYIEYRPQNISEIDEERAREAILSFAKNERFPHALLFAGPKGTGKTSTARIVAKILNCEKTKDKLGEPCNNCAICREITNGNSMCVVEVDAASHRGIDDIRALRDTVNLMPAGGRTKVYIIDEAHMLTTEAANALLKTLEEPPENVVFILATTESSKIPETIRSRATLIQFSKAKKEELARSLARIVEREKLKVDSQALELIASKVDGSFRDATKLLEQLADNGKVTNETVDSFFTASISDPITFLGLVAQKDAKSILTEIENIVSKGVNPRDFTIQLIETLHKQLLANAGIGENEKGLKFQSNEIKHLIDLLTHSAESMKTSPIAQLPLEVAMVSWCEKEDGSQTTRLSSNSPSTKGGTDTRDLRSAKSVDSDPLVSGSNIEDMRSLSDSPSSVVGVVEKKTKEMSERKLEEISEDVWRQLLAKVKNQNFSLEALLKSARPVSFDGRDVTVAVFYKFHKDKLEEESHRKVLEQILCELLGAEVVRVFFVLGEKPQTVIADNSIIISDIAPNESGEGENLNKIAEDIFGAEIHD